MQLMMAQSGAGSLLVEVVALSPYADLVFDGFRFAAEFLANGNRACQDALLGHLEDSPELESRKFFVSIQDRIYHAIHLKQEYYRKLQERQSQARDIGLTETRAALLYMARENARDMNNRTGIIELMRMLQLMCEGHNTKMQELLESQEVTWRQMHAIIIV